MPDTQQVLADDEVFVIQQNEINEAINRSREALYKPSGVTECIDCGDEIPLERKIAIPSTERCTPCAEVHEKRNKIGSDQSRHAYYTGLG
jgi:RNA polymerase-binding transcription factor DksA